MTNAIIVSAAKTIDDVGCIQHTLHREQQINDLGIAIRELVIEPLSADWHSVAQPDHFRSGCAPLEALAAAKQAIANGEQAVLIRGEDNLRTGYDRDQRLELMAVYGADYPLTEAYTDLSRRFLQQYGADDALFKTIAASLFDNHQQSFRNALSDDFSMDMLPGERWHKPITSLFRGVDCANPLIDFSGRVLLCHPDLVKQLQIPADECMEVLGVGLGQLPLDGKEAIDDIASYDHLKEAYQACCRDAGIDFASEFRAGHALLEAYTCYPVVPIAFLMISGLVDVLEEIPEFLEQHSITVTGGMNLAKAPWNNPALNALITMHHRLLEGEEQIGLIHGNGGLGYRQGVALIGKLSV